MATARPSRDEHLKMQELRKAGSKLAEKDEQGREINPHIPMFIAHQPWYLGSDQQSKDGLAHQRAAQSTDDHVSSIDRDGWYKRGQDALLATAATGPTKFRKGACENCGAMSHKTRDCVERPRRLGAKWTGKNIRPDERLQNVNIKSFEAKRDRWNGYNPEQYRRVVDDYEQIEEARKKLHEKQLEEELLAKKAEHEKAKKEKNDLDILSDSDEEEEHVADPKDKDLQSGETNQTEPKKTMIQNLRVREDTAKYLRNLDLDSAYYDPKTRSMRENPLAEKETKDESFVGDNFVRWTGDAPKLAQMQVFAWDAAERGIDINLQADPTRAALLHKEYENRKNTVKSGIRDNIIQRYGGEEHIKAPPKELLPAQTDVYIEYSQSGKVIRGQAKAVARSKYEEDNYGRFGSGHSSVWGSFYDIATRKWGYACCRSTFRSAFCTGAAGIEAAKANPVNQSINMRNMKESDDNSEEQPKSLADLHVTRMVEEMKRTGKTTLKRKQDSSVPFSAANLSSSLYRDPSLDPEKLKKAIAENNKKRKADSMDKDGFQSEHVKPSEEDLEAFRLTKQHHEDPMANYIDHEAE